MSLLLDTLAAIFVGLSTVHWILVVAFLWAPEEPPLLSKIILTGVYVFILFNSADRLAGFMNE